MKATHQYLPGMPNWPIFSQDPTIATPRVKAFAESVYLPALVAAWQHIEETTGFAWKSTSYWRKSVSHITGAALDIAPDIAPKYEGQYAVHRGSDPVLYKRTALIRKLQLAAQTMPDTGFTIGIVIEPDHLHIQLFRAVPTLGPARLIKWKQPKESYGDTHDRIELPMLP